MTIKNILLFVVTLLLLSSCSNFLDRKKVAAETEEEFFKTVEQMERATISVYDALGRYNSLEMMEWMIGDICSDDAEKGGSDPSDMAELQALKDFDRNPYNSLLLPRWSEPYQGIFRANQVIVNGERLKGGFSGDDKKAIELYIAEAKFLRGYYYFMLVKTFGGVPLVTDIPDPSEYCRSRASESDSWKQIIKDFKDAAEDLPEVALVAGRATKGAAYAMAAKAALYKAGDSKKSSDFDDVVKYAEKVVNSGKYKLLENFADNFSIAGENGEESIFEIQYETVATWDWGDDNEGQVFSIFQGSRDNEYFTGWGFNIPTENLVKAFDDENDDVRKAATIVFAGDTLYKGTPHEEIAKNEQYKRHNRKYMLEYAGDSKPEMSNAPANWRVMRYADLLLIYAEGLYRSNRRAEAADYVNMVRERAKLPKKDNIDLDDIYTERRLELALEGHRYFDVIRQGEDRAKKVLGDKFSWSKRFLPIPQAEIDLCDKIKQN